MKYLILFEQRGDSLKIFLKDDLTAEQGKALESVNGYIQNQGNTDDIETVLDDICGVVFEGEWDDDKIYDSDDDQGEKPYELNAPVIGLKIIHIGSM